MTILTTAYNCEPFIERSISSIMSQKFRDYKCYILDDLSTDNTVSKIKESIKEDERFILIENKTKLYQPGNYDLVIRHMNLPDDEICVEVDGDDWLPNSNVLSFINEVYQNNDVWMTSGSFSYHNGRPGFASPPNTIENLRKQTFTLSHLRTWKSWLWKKIDEEDLKDETGNYWSVAGDLAFMFPMLEMSGMEHYKFVSEKLYIYNESNPLNDHKVNMSNVVKTANIIRNKTSYTTISNGGK
jgi:glycosyltransferase involved in cell wall biosynthesis